MLTKSTSQGLTWIDMHSPTKDDVATVRAEYGIHPAVAEELLAPSYRSKVDVYSEAVYLILHFPAWRGGSHKSLHDVREIDFVIGKNFLITVHYENIEQFYDLTKLFEVSELMANTHTEHRAPSGSALLYHILRSLYRGIEHDLERVNQRMKEIETQIYTGRERQMVERISTIAKVILDFRWALKVHEDVLSSLEHDAEDFWDERFSHYLRSLLGEYYKIWNTLESYHEIAQELRLTNDSLLTTKTNEVMKVLTILAFVTFPLSLIASIFSMNTAHTPLVNSPNGFWLIVGGMLLAFALMLAYFKHRRWM